MADLEGKIEIVDQRRGVLASGSLRVGVTIRSTATEILRIESRFEWFDAQGFSLDRGSSNWKPVQVDPGDTLDVEGVAPNGEAVSYRLSLRPENPYVGDPDGE